jgi:Flp pilus assembly protein TadD
MDYPTRLINVHTPYFLGKAAMESGRVELAQRWFARALALGADMAWLQSNIGGIYAQHGLIALARARFEKAAALDPYFYEGPFGLGYVALKEDRFADAVASLQQAVRMEPTRSDGWYMLGVACYEAHDVPAARRAWGQYLALDPGGAMADTVRKKLQEQ